MGNEVSKAKSARQLLSSDVVKDQIAKALPGICSPERFMRVAMTAITKNPKIADTTQESMMSCLLDCAQLGIEPDGRRAHLIPYGKSCTLIIDYKGLVELVRRSGEVKTISADSVCDNDEFEVNMGKITRHTINYKKDRGQPYAYYAYAEMADGSIQSEVMTIQDINAIKARSRSGGSGPWKTDFAEMAKKTVFRRLCKWLPMNAEVAQKLQEVEKMEFDFEMPKKEAEFKDASDIDVEG
jgi:recombination protein RecT